MFVAIGAQSSQNWKRRESIWIGPICTGHEKPSKWALWAAPRYSKQVLNNFLTTVEVAKLWTVFHEHYSLFGQSSNIGFCVSTGHNKNSDNSSVHPCIKTFFIAFHDRSWNIMIYTQKQWNIMMYIETVDISHYMMYHKLLWCIMNPYGISWTIMKNHDLLWFAILHFRQVKPYYGR